MLTTVGSKSAPTQQARKDRLKRLIRSGLPPFPQTAVALTKVWGGSSPDLQRAGKLICADPTLSSQVLRICNSPMFVLRSRVVSIERAAVLLGVDRFRNLALSSSVVDFARKALPESRLNAFWQHSFMAAKLSRYLAQRRKFLKRTKLI